MYLELTLRLGKGWKNKRILTLYFMIQNQDLQLSWPLCSGLGGRPGYSFSKLSLKSEHGSPPISLDWSLPQFLCPDPFWEDINEDLVHILKVNIYDYCIHKKKTVSNLLRSKLFCILPTEIFQGVYVEWLNILCKCLVHVSHIVSHLVLPSNELRPERLGDWICPHSGDKLRKPAESLRYCVSFWCLR